MSHYDTRPEDLITDTKSFLKSDFGQYVMGILADKQAGFLSQASNMAAEHPDRYLAKYIAVKEVVDLINSPLDDDISPRG